MKRKFKSYYRKEPKDDLLQTYCRQIKAFPLLDAAAERELSRRIQQGDTAAMHRLVNANLRLVLKIVRPYVSADVPILDLIQEGNLGLLHAAERYDHTRNVRFCTYAGWWVRQFINRYLTNKRRIVRLPCRKEEILRKIQRAYHSLSQRLMHQPTSSEIAEELGIAVHEVDTIINMSSGPLPLEVEGAGEDGTAVVELHEDYTYSPERTLLRKFSRDGAVRFLDSLKERERQVLAYRYELNGSGRCTLKEIGDELDLSPETVRQIEIKALQKIRSHAGELRNYVFMEAI
ncbi:MAG: RNA polymerase sigma factor RpoD/SigA [Treponema sp.]|jgi:RNA polymerase primary sigma factor|nr:RNA polymerase sigma factor RpoD/SigA [Treponema sp.]